jgi:hypothetical protein
LQADAGNVKHRWEPLVSIDGPFFTKEDDYAASQIRKELDLCFFSRLK